MNSQNYNVKLNMKDSGVVESGIRMKQGDSLMRLVFTIYEGGSIYFNANDVPKVYFRRPDGTTVFGTAESSTDNYIYVIKGNELQLAGTVLCDVKFTLENGRESSCTFKMEVVPDTISANTGGSGIYDNDLAEIVEEIEDLKDEVEEIATESSENATLAKSYAVGGTGTRAGEDTDNAKYYMEQSKTITGIGKGNLTIKQGGTVAGTFNANSLTDVEIDLTSGTTVSVDQITSTGTHIADITVDGTKTELYAPNNGGGTWGSITGTLSNQTDLNTALGGKQDKLTAGTNILIDSNNVISVTGGGSGGLLPEVYITSESDATVTVTNGTVTLTPTKKSSTTWYTSVPSFGDWTIHSVNSLGDVEYTLAVDTVKIYQVAVNHFTAYIKVNYTTGATVTLTNNGQSVSVTSSGQKVAVHSSGNWLATASFDAQTSQSKTVVISTEGQEETVTLDGFAKVTVTYAEDLVGETITLSNGTKSYSKLATSSLSTQFIVSQFGSWTLATSVIEQSVSIPSKGTYTFELTSGPDYQGWLDAAGITTTFASLEAVLADEPTVRILMTKHDAVDYLVTWASSDETTGTLILGTDLCAKWINLRDYALDTLYANTTIKTIMDSVDKYFYGEWVQVDGTWGAKGNVPIMTSNSAPYGEASAGSTYNDFYPWKAFADNTSGWLSNGTNWISYKFVNPTCVKKFMINFADAHNSVTVSGSNDNSTYTNIETIDVSTQEAGVNKTYKITNDNYYLYYKLTITKASGNAYVKRLQFYGRELSVSVPTMTSNTDPWGEVTESDHHDINYGYYAFGTSNSWISAMSTTDGGEYVGFDFKNSVVPKVVAFRCSGTNRYSVGTYKIQGYKNNAWVDIDTITTPADTTLRLYPINNSNAYEKVRFLAVHSCQVGGGYYYSFVNSLNIYGLDYSEHAERHYIYDNGVEVETLAKGGSSPNVAEKTTNELRLTCASTDASIKPWFATSSSIDMSQYNLSRAIVGNEIVYGKDFMTVSQSGSGQAEDYTYMELTTSNVTCWYVDLSNENRSAYPVVKINNTSGSKLTVTEWWLE